LIPAANDSQTRLMLLVNVLDTCEVEYSEDDKTVIRRSWRSHDASESGLSEGTVSTAQHCHLLHHLVLHSLCQAGCTRPAVQAAQAERSTPDCVASLLRRNHLRLRYFRGIYTQISFTLEVTAFAFGE
jgi:hypothetical protein